jgi:hypothetical protein
MWQISTKQLCRSDASKRPDFDPDPGQNKFFLSKFTFLPKYRTGMPNKFKQKKSIFKLKYFRIFQAAASSCASSAVGLFV